VGPHGHEPRPDDGRRFFRQAIDAATTATKQVEGV